MSVTRLPRVATAKTIRAASYLALVAAGLFWGLGFVFGKYALADMPVAAMVTFRFLIASAALVPIIFFRRIHIARGDLLIFAIAALLFVPVQFLIQFEGLARTTVTQASLMVALAPVMIAVASTIVRIPGSARPKWFAIAASAGGAALVVFGPAGNVGIVGDALVAISLLAGVAWILITERRMKDYDPIVACACVIWMGTAMLVAFEAIVHPHQLLAPYSTSAWLATAGSGILSTAAATVFWTIGLHNVPASDAGVFINLEPLVGALCGVALFGDGIGWPLVTGAILIIAAAVVVTRGSAAPPAPQVRRPPTSEPLYSRTAAAAE
jgi:drug/metabolite transporter (DMT)-like permease